MRALLGTAACLFAVAAFIWIDLPDVRPLRTENPESTAFMRMRVDEAMRERRPMRIRHRWVPYDRLPQSLKLAVVVSEDMSFFDHDGLDYGELRIVLQQNWWRPWSMRGASTITQQLAKNLYLSPSRNPARKLRELFITRRLEAELSKTRILELYLNLIEWGDGIWGAEAASLQYFGISAGQLSAEQAALLAAAIINPRVYSPARPNARLLRRQKLILDRMERKTPPTEKAAEKPIEKPVEKIEKNPGG